MKYFSNNFFVINITSDELYGILKNFQFYFIISIIQNKKEA